MKVESIYANILEQAATFAMARPDDAIDLPEQAERLADELYRLCVEFGVTFNEFKTTVIDESLNYTRLLDGTLPENTEVTGSTLLEPVKRHLPLVILALELMRDDVDY